MIEDAIRKSSQAFIAEERAMEMLVCGMLGALKSLGGSGSVSGQMTVTDVFALGLWSALGVPKPGAIGRTGSRVPFVKNIRGRFLEPEVCRACDIARF